MLFQMDEEVLRAFGGDGTVTLVSTIQYQKEEDGVPPTSEDPLGHPGILVSVLCANL